MKTLFQDVRFGLRVLLKTPAFSLVAIISLALGIGLNTAIFSIVNAVLICPLPIVKQQNRLVWLRAPISYPDYLDYRNQTQSFEGMAAITGTQDFSIASGSEPELVKGEYVTPNYFDVLGAGAFLGRVFVEEDATTQAPIVILSEHLWRTRFASDSNIAGRQISLNGFSFTVVGVMPKNFIGTEAGLNRELWLPLSMHRLLNPPAAARIADPGSRQFEERDTHWLAVFARLKPDVLALLLAGIGIYGVVSYGAAQRTREIGVRMALGAKEKDVLRLVLWDGLIVIGAGLVIGLLLAAAATRLIAAFLYGVGATDPLTFVTVPLLLGFVALVASYVPARRAVKLDPLVALRYE